MNGASGSVQQHVCMWIFATSENFNSIHKSFDLETSCSVGADIVRH